MSRRHVAVGQRVATVTSDVRSASSRARAARCTRCQYLPIHPEIEPIDADLRRSTIASVLGIEPLPGLSEVLRGEKTLQEAIVRLEQLPTLHILPAGVGSSNPVELLDSCLRMIDRLEPRIQAWVTVDRNRASTS